MLGGKKTYSTFKSNLACSIFGHLVTSIHFVLIYWRAKTSSQNHFYPTPGPRIVIIYIFVTLGYQLLFTNCMWNSKMLNKASFTIVEKVLDRESRTKFGIFCFCFCFCFSIAVTTCFSGLEGRCFILVLKISL